MVRAARAVRVRVRYRLVNPSEEPFAHIRDYYLEPKNEWARARIARVLDAANPRPGERALDLGCANGTFSFHLAKAGAKPVGIDLDENALRTGREFAMRFAGISTARVRGNALRLPFPDASFDLIVNADFIEHTPAEAKPPIFREMFRVLKPGARAVVYTPNLNRVRWELLGEHLKRACGFRKTPVPRWQDYVDPDHYGLTTPWLTLRQLRAAGFEAELRYHEFHMPLISHIPGANAVLSLLLSHQFANRFLIRLHRP
jgi:SAM-dependent methyltransferase